MLQSHNIGNIGALPKREDPIIPIFSMEDLYIIHESKGNKGIDNFQIYLQCST